VESEWNRSAKSPDFALTIQRLETLESVCISEDEWTLLSFKE